jgi:ACR3 family arsenite efflux pump ArsB/nucleotide-binding universal stress UspA family protein
MWKLLTILQKNLVWSIPISMFAGLLYGYRFETTPLKQFIIPVTFIMVYPMMATLNVQSIFKGKDTKLQVTTQVVNFVIIPLIAYMIGKIFFSNGLEKYGLWAVGLFLIGVLPTSGMTISWTGFARGNKEAAIKMVVFGLVLGALAAPIYTKIFMGATIDVDMLHMFKQIALFVFVPLSLGMITQYLVIKKYGKSAWNQHIKPKFPPFSALGVILIAFVAMALKAKNIIANPGDIVSILVPLTVFYLVTYVFLSLAGKLFFSREDAIAMVFGVVMRDLSIALAIAMTAFGKQGLTIALLIALAYVVQIQSAAWYVRLVDVIFGKTTTEPGTRQDAAAAGTSLKKAAIRTPPPLEAPPLVPAMQRILLATDLSPSARYAALHACSLGNQYQAEVTVMHVIPDMIDLLSSEAGVDLADFIHKSEWKDYHKKGIEKARQLMTRRIRETSRKVVEEIPHCPLSEDNIRVGIGNPAMEIVTAAREGDYDLIIMGSHGHGKLEETMIGSVTQEVIRQSSIPVLVVRLPPAYGFKAQPVEDVQLEEAPLTH